MTTYVLTTAPRALDGADTQEVHGFVGYYRLASVRLVALPDRTAADRQLGRYASYGQNGWAPSTWLKYAEVGLVQGVEDVASLIAAHDAVQPARPDLAAQESWRGTGGDPILARGRLTGFLSGVAVLSGEGDWGRVDWRGMADSLLRAHADGYQKSV